MSDKSSQFIGHLTAFATYAIFGFNIIFCKGIAANGNIPPIALTTFRSLGAAILLWALSLFTPKEKVERQDFLKILFASFMGLFVPQLTFLSACLYTTTIDTSILSSLTPIMTMFVAAIFLKEPITWKKAGGVALSFAGVVFLILNSASTSNGVDHTRPEGVLLLILNTFSFAMYLGVFRPLVSKYSVVTFMKWAFLMVFFMSLPLSANSIIQINYGAIPTTVWLEIGYLIFFATFLAYFLLPMAQKRIRPTLISLYGYLQPIIATVVSICIGTDVMSWQKGAAVLFVCTGVWVVNRSRAANTATAPAAQQSESKR